MPSTRLRASFLVLVTGLIVWAGAAEAASASEATADQEPAAPAESDPAQVQVDEPKKTAKERIAEIFGNVDAGQDDAGTRVAEIFQQNDAHTALEQSAVRRVKPSSAPAPTPLAEQEAAAHAEGTLFLQKPTPSSPATFVGHGGYSADGFSASLGANLRADLPPGSTPVQAWLYGYFQSGNPTPAEATVNFDGSPVALTKLDDYSFSTLSSARADVTSQVAAKVASTGGFTNFAAATALPLDGLALVVVYSNPSLPLTTVAVFDGAAQRTGDTATFTFAAPLDKTVPGFSAKMSLGIGFSYQQGSGHICGPGSPVSKQYSVIDVNGSRLTSCAGGDDDTITGGGLFTVGGVGDSLDNPADPLQSPGDGNPLRVRDDELYNLEPFLSQGDTKLIVTTSQPSNDDLLFLSIVQVDAAARVTTEVCGDEIDNDGDGLIDGSDPDVVCPTTPPPLLEICGDGIDNDGDGLIDELDLDCPVVRPPLPIGLNPITPGVVGPLPPSLITPQLQEPALTAPAVRAVHPKVSTTARPAIRKTLPRTGGSPLWEALGGLVLLALGLAALRASRRETP